MRNKKIYSLLIWLTLALLIGTVPAFAGDDARIGTAGGVQVLVPVGARDLAMGGSNVANTAGVDAIYWNPAGLSRMKGTAAGAFSTMSIFNDIHVNYLALGFKAGAFGNLGVSLKSFSFGDIPETTIDDPDGLSGRTFSPTFVTAGLTYARRLTDAIQVGFTGKLIYESIPRASGSAFAFDMGIQYNQLGGIPGLAIGLTVKNIGTNLTYKGSGLITQTTSEYLDRIASNDQLPAVIELGVGYQRTITEENNLLISGVFLNNNFGNDNYKFGAEYNFRDLFALRGGYLLYENTNTSDVLYRFTLGAGLHYNVSGTDLTFDYTYRDSQYFDGNNLFSVGIGF
jgi:hypothetical protein